MTPLRRIEQGLGQELPPEWVSEHGPRYQAKHVNNSRDKGRSLYHGYEHTCGEDEPVHRTVCRGASSRAK